MLIELLKLERLKVGVMDEGTAIGSVYRIVVNPDELKIIGFMIKIGNLMPKLKAISFFDVVDIDQHGLTIHSRENIADATEVVRLNELVHKKYSLIGQTIKTKSGKKIGRVSDALAETTTGDILRIYSKSLISDFVFERSQIEKVTLREVIVKNIGPKGAKVDKKAVPAEKLAEAA